MGVISITDFSGSADLELGDGSTLAKTKLTGLKTQAHDVCSVFSQPLASVKFESADVSACFTSPALPVDSVKLTVNANTKATLALLDSDDALFKDDCDPLTSDPGKRWMSFAVDTEVDVKASAKLPDGFGVGACVSTEPVFTTYVVFDKNVAFGKAIEGVLNAFQVPVSAEQVLTIPENVVYASDVSGSVTVSGSWSLPIAVDQLSLASADLPFDASVKLSPALTLAVKGSIELDSDFSVRIHRVNASTIRMGLYKKHGSTFKTTFTAGAGLAANLGDTDLIGTFFGAVMPGVDTNVCPDDVKGAVDAVLKKTVDYSMAASLNACCSAATSDEAAILYEITSSDAQAQAAIDSALRGNWDALAKLPSAKPIRHVIDQQLEKKITLQINVLGIYNYASVADFARDMKAVHNDEDGSTTLTDSGTAKRIAVASTPFIADKNNLRKVLQESFTITAAYKALLQSTGAQPTFSAKQSYFEYCATLPYRQALKRLHAGEALGVMPAATLTALPASGDNVSHARFIAKATFSNDDVLRIFSSRSRDELIAIGRRVLASLLDPQDQTDRSRIQALTDDKTWSKLSADPPNIPAPYFVDFNDVSWWADAISDAAAAIRSSASEPFESRRKTVASALCSVTKNTHAAFEHAFPICATAALCSPDVTFDAMWNSKTIFTHAPAAAQAKTGSAT